jgi:hypothetical protein
LSCLAGDTAVLIVPECFKEIITDEYIERLSRFLKSAIKKMDEFLENDISYVSF